MRFAWCFDNFFDKNLRDGPERRKAEVAPFGTASADITSNPWTSHQEPDPEPSSCFCAWKKGSLPPAQISTSSFSSFFARSFALHLACKVKGEAAVFLFLTGIVVPQYLMPWIFQMPCGKGRCGRIAGEAASQILSVFYHHVDDFCVIHG